MSGTTNAPTESGGIWDRLIDFGIDGLRARYIDVEQTSDDNNIPDRTDVRLGALPQAASNPWVLGGGALLLALLAALFIRKG